MTTYLIAIGICDDFSVPRKSKDNVVNKFGGVLLIYVVTSMYIIMLNGRTVSDPVGEFTYLDNRGGSSVIDYMLVSSDLYPTVIDFEVLPADYSDHFPIEGKFKCDLDTQSVKLNYLDPY